MGHLKQGIWHSDEVATSGKDGSFERESSAFREQIAQDHKKYQPEANRYHLYVSYACPWAHRTLITRHLKGLQDVISYSVVHPEMLENSWEFRKDFEGATGDGLYEKDFLYQIYQKHDLKVTTKVTVPILWDRKTESIVNNESSEIIRIFNTAFEFLRPSDLDLYPDHLQKDIDQMNELTYEPINNGVYKSGFAKNQAAYEKACSKLFETLDKVEKHLEGKTYLVGTQLTEADVRLFTTLIRFDSVYYVHFKCNVRKISEYKNLSRYLEHFMKLEAFQSTTNMKHIKHHYYYSHDFINPYRIVPLGPA